MPFFDFLFGAAPAVERFRGQAITANITALAQALAGEAAIRLYVDRGGGTGQQAAAINLLKRIIAPTVPAAPNTPPGLGYTGQGRSVDIIYDDAADTTLTNLRRLLGLAADATQGVFQGLQVELLPLSAPGQLALVGYSFSAATDGGADIAYETICVASRHLRLQPFMYGDAGKEQLRFAGAPPEVIGLATRPEIGGAAFHELGFYLPTSPLDTIAWDAFEAAAAADPARLRRIRVLRYLIETQYRQAGSQLVKQYDLLFTYGIHTTLWRDGTTGHVNAIGITPTDQVVELTLGVMATQLDSTGRAVAGALPALIVNVDDFWYDELYFGAAERAANPPPSIFREVERLLAGGLASGEPDPAAPPPAVANAGRQTRLQIVAFRRAYLQAVGLAAGADGQAPPQRFTGLDDPDVAAATAALTVALQAQNAAQRVLWVQQAPIPADLFNALLGRSTLPAVFEGNNTANQALSFPRIYYNTNRPRAGAIRYPSRVLATRPGEALLQTLQKAANQVGLPLSGWPDRSDAASWPPEVFAGPIRAWRAEPMDPSEGRYHSYFKGVSDFFREVSNDKFSLAFAFLGQEIQARAAPPAPRLAAVHQSGLAQRESALVATGTQLAALYAALNANLTGGTLALLPGALDPGGQIAKLLSGVLGLTGPLSVGAATITAAGGSPPPDDGGSITVAGTCLIGGLDLVLQAVFTVARGSLAAEVTLSASARLPPLAGLEWAPFTAIAMVIEVADGPAIPVIQAKAELQWPGAGETVAVSWPLALAGGTLKVTGDFAPALSLDYAFKLAGGVNLLSQVRRPSPCSPDWG